MNQTIIFIHGMFQNSKSWQKWTSYFNQKGYDCIAPDWPCHSGEPKQIREHTPDNFGELELEDILDKMERIVIEHGGKNAKMDQKPIVIGHSVGGLVTQIFANRGLMRLGVPISSVAPNMMMSADWPFFKNTVEITNPLKGDKPFEQTVKSFHKSFCNTLNDEEAQQAFEQTAIPGSRKVLRECLGPTARIDLDETNVPLFFITGSEDKIIPTELVEKNYKKYKDKGKNVGFERFQGRSHFICNESGWEEVVDSAANWLDIQQPSLEEQADSKVEDVGY